PGVTPASTPTASSPPVTGPPLGAGGDVPCIFNSGLTGWTVAESGGTAAAQGTVTVEDGHAVLREGDSFLVTLARTFTIPDPPSTLTFAYSDLAFDTTARHAIKDAFEVALVDAHGQPLVHPIGKGRDAFFNLAEGQAAALGAEATLTQQTVTLDLAPIP